MHTSRRRCSAPRPRPTRSPAPSSAAGPRSSCCSRCSRNSPIPGCSAHCHRPTASWPRARAGTGRRCPAASGGSPTCPAPCRSSTKSSDPRNPGPKGIDVRPHTAEARRMDTTLTRHLPVATCIGCGARSNNAECTDGCTDLPLDLVDVDDLVAIATRAEALDERVAELREVARALVEDDPVDWSAVHERARAAVLIAVPEAPEADVIEGWGCPRCGRVDAPQQCLGICIRRPGLVADVTEYARTRGTASGAARFQGWSWRPTRSQGKGLAVVWTSSHFILNSPSVDWFVVPRAR